MLQGPDDSRELDAALAAPPRIWQSVAVALGIVGAVHLVWGLLYIFHARVNPALPRELWWMLAAGAVPFLLLAAAARLAPRAAAVAGVLALLAIHLAIAIHYRDPMTLVRGPLFKTLMLVILLRAMIMALGARDRGRS